MAHKTSTSRARKQADTGPGATAVLDPPGTDEPGVRGQGSEVSAEPRTLNPEHSPGTLRTVSIAQIGTELPNHRHDHRHDEAALASLAESMRDQGLLEPVMVVEDSHAARNGPPIRYQLVYGHRRLAAAKLLGWPSIAAQVRPPMSSDDILALRAIENLHRQDLNVMEEVLAVEHLMKQAPDGEPAAQVELVAAKLGMSSGWVRDRLYLAVRLCEPVKKMALEDRLLIGHLRELAKLGSAADQKMLADWGARQRDGSGRLETVEWFRAKVAERRRSLRGVAWRLDVAFAGKPACVGCGHNSASDPLLFAMDDPKAKDGFCLNGPCFETKSHRVEQEKAKAVAKLAKRKEPDLSIGAVAAVVPDHVRPESVQRLAKKKIGAAGSEVRDPGSEEQPRPSGGAGCGDVSKTPRGRFRKAFKMWRDGVYERIVEAASGSPMQFAGLALAGMEEGPLDTYPLSVDVDLDYSAAGAKNHEPPDLAEPSLDEEDEAVLAAALEGSAGGIERLIKAINEQDSRYSHPLAWLSDLGPVLLGRVAGALGVMVEPPPVWEDFAPKQAARPAAQDTEKKPGKRSKKKKEAAGV